MADLIEHTLLVVEAFKSEGVEYRAGDRVPLRQRRIRRVALERPEFFRQEYATVPVDVARLAELDRAYDDAYDEALRIHGTAESRRKEAERAELEAQERAKPDQRELELRFEKQEAERRAREAKVGEDRKRETQEAYFASMSGFNY